MTKRRRLILEAVIIAFGFLATQFVDINWRYSLIAIIGVVTYFLTAFVLKEDLRPVGWLTVLPSIVCYVVFTNLFYFLLPSGILVRLLILVLFAIGLYAILLAENIFSVASSFHTIQLLRAGQAVGFFLMLLTAFFGYNTLFSFKQIAWINAPIVFLITLPLSLSSLWSISLEEKISGRLIIYSLIISFLAAQMAFFISFWPLTITTSSLFLVSILYVILGICQAHFNGRLFEDTIKEFLQVGVVIFIITFLLASWG